jgi:hypothetical protein
LSLFKHLLILNLNQRLMADTLQLSKLYHPDTEKSAGHIYKIAVGSIIIIGILFRLFHYFNNRSLWEDEIYLSTGIEHLRFLQLFSQPLDFQQKAPVGYLAVVKVFTLLFGRQELALRLFPLLCGIASLICFLPVARYFLRPVGVIIAMSLLAVAPPLVYHSVEAKQYATELFATILILLLYVNYHAGTNAKSLFAWGVWGAIIPWFSYSSVFILIGVAFTMSLYCIITRNISLLKRLFIPFTLWLGSFAVNYILFIRKDSHTGWLLFFFSKHDAFMPSSARAVPWLFHQMFGFFNYPLGLSWFTIYNDPSVIRQILVRMAIIPVIFSITGVIYLYRANKKLLCIIAFTLFLVLLASSASLYPFTERLVVFLAPLAILLLAAGCQALFTKQGRLPVWQTTLVLLLFFGPVKNIVAQTINPGLFGDYKKSYQREALLYLNSKYQLGDIVYIYWNDLPGYHLYKQMYPLKYTAVEGRDYRHTATSFSDYFNKLGADLQPLMSHKHVWIIQNNNIDIPIGDYIGDPAWYYLYNDGPKRFHDYILRYGTVSDEFHPADKEAVSDINVIRLN